MARIDPLLKMIVAQGGNQMVLRAHEQPQLFHSGSPLRLFLPPMAASLIEGMITPLLDADARATFSADEDTEFTHENKEFGTFVIRVSNLGPKIAVRIERRSEVADEAEPPTAAKPMGAPGITRATRSTTLKTPAGPRIVPSKLAGLIEMALARGASDIHLADAEPPVMRVDGRLIALDDTPVSYTHLTLPTTPYV